MEYETVYSVIYRAMDEGSDDPDNLYAGVRFVREGEPLAHAAAPPGRVPVCGTTTKFIVPGLPWSDPISAEYRRCPECEVLCPL